MQHRGLLALASLFALTATGGPVLADDAASTIAGCLKAEREAGRPLSNCIGRVADPCTETPDGQSTVGSAMCMDKEAKIWDGILNEEYGRLIGLLKKEAGEDVRKAQRIWLTSRDADCRVPYYFYEGGSIVQIIGARCMLDHTADRALLIRSWREMAQGEGG